MDRLTGEELRLLRERFGLTSYQLADELGLHSNAVRSWEERKVPPMWLRVWFIGYEYQKAITEAAECKKTA